MAEDGITEVRAPAQGHVEDMARTHRHFYLSQQRGPFPLFCFDLGTYQDKFKLLNMFTICLLKRCSKIMGGYITVCYLCMFDVI